MKVHVENYGCSMNQSLGEYLEGYLISSGLDLVDDRESADVIVLNTCTVKGRTERRMLRKIRDIQRSWGDKQLVIAGCMPTVQGELLDQEAPAALKFGTGEYHLIPSAIRGHRPNLERPEVPFCERPLGRPGIGIVPVSDGCTGRCTFCIVRLIKGGLRSYPVEEILSEVRRLTAKGIHEVWLTAQDLAAYGGDGGEVKLPGLVAEILGLVDDRARIRLGMMNPRSLEPVFDGMVDIYRDQRVFNFIHLPVQSGSNRILRLMGRRYSVERWEDMVNELRNRLQSFTVATDLIVGYPLERDEDFAETLELVRDIKPDVVNLSRYEHRPGTEASRLRELPGSEVKRRSREASELIRQVTLEVNRDLIGWTGRCLVSEKGRKGGYVARNDSYRPVIIDGSHELGSWLEVEIDGATENYLMGHTTGRDGNGG
jgi:MiaB-like tRNA modifying enzyme